MQPADKRPEVVYRKTPTEEARRVRSALSRWQGYAPALGPLIVGFLLLLGLISALGFLSANKMYEVGMFARAAADQSSARLGYLFDLRLRLTRLDSEARLRARTESSSEQQRRDLLPPFEFKLNLARQDVAAAMEILDKPPLSGEESWQKFRGQLQSYVESTKDVKAYSLDGFETFRDVEASLNDLFETERKKQDERFDAIQTRRNQARRSIIDWVVLALLVGALVAVGTIWQVQRQFRAMQHSMFETRRERTFTTQLFEGMVSAVAAIDEEDRIRSANAAFFRIFPKASIGASVLERFAPDDVMKILDTVTSVRVNKATYHGRLVAQVEESDKAFDVYSAPLAINGDRGQIVTQHRYAESNAA